MVRGSDIQVGAQNMYYQEKGAFTGEISPLMLKDFCEYVIIDIPKGGSISWRWQFISQKVISAIKHNLKPILCVGENLEQYEAGKTGR